MENSDFNNLFGALDSALKRKDYSGKSDYQTKRQKTHNPIPGSPFKIVSANLDNLEFPHEGDPIKITHENFSFWLGDLTRSNEPFWGQSFSFDSSPMLKRLTQVSQKQGKYQMQMIFDGRHPFKKSRYPQLSPLALKESNALFHQKVFLSGGQGMISTGNLSESAEDANKQINLTLAFNDPNTTKILKDNSEAILFRRKSALDCNQKVSIGGQKVEFWYTPDSDHLVEQRILELLDQAQPDDHLYVAIYTMTSWKLARKIIDLHKAGVNVHFHIDKGQTHRIPMQKEIVQSMIKHGIAVRVNTKGMLHTKSIALNGKDSEFLVTGSLNYTKAGVERNYEIVAVLPTLTRSQSEEIDSYHKFLATRTKPVNPSKL